MTVMSGATRGKPASGGRTVKARAGGRKPTSDPLPTAASSPRRSVVAWWVVFWGPAAIVGALAIAGSVGDGVTAVWVFALGVWAFTLTLGLAAAPRSSAGLWWIAPLVASFVASVTSLGLLLAIVTVGDAVSEKPEPTVPTSESTTTSR